MIQQLISLVKNRLFPTNLVFELTYRCNLDCRICYLKFSGTDKYIDRGRELTFDEIKSVLDALALNIPLINKKLPHTVFTGGEIFLRNDVMDILAYASRKTDASIFTNGLLLSDEIIRDLVAIDLEMVMFSLDGPQKAHDLLRNKEGAFDKTVSNIEKMARLRKEKRKRRPIIQINTVISDINAGSLPDLIPIAEDIGADRLVFASEDLSSIRWLGAVGEDKKEYLTPPPKMKFDKLSSLRESLTKIKESMNKKNLRIEFIPFAIPDEVLRYYSNNIAMRNYTCYYPWTTMRISAYGDIFPCYRFKIGNIREDGPHKLKKMWNSKAYREFREAIKKEGLFPGCLGCGRLVKR